MKIKSITDVITNSSTEVFICTSSKSESELRDIFKHEDNHFLNWFSNIIKFDLALYRTWSRKIKEKEESDYEFSVDYLDEKSYPELTIGYPFYMYVEIYEHFPDRLLKNDKYYNLHLSFLLNPKKEELRIIELEGEMKYRIYEELREPTDLIKKFKEKLKEGVDEIKKKCEEDRSWHEELLMERVNIVNGDVDTSRLQYSSSILYQLGWVGEFIDTNIDKFPKYENLIKMYDSLPDVSMLDNNFIDTFDDDCLPKDYRSGFEKLDTIVEDYNCYRLS